MKKGLVCLSIIAILMLCLPNIAVATTSKYSTTFHNNVRHTGDYIPMARGNTSNSILDWKYATKSIVTSSAAPNDVVYVGSNDGNIYALDARTGVKVWSYTTGGDVKSSPTVANGIVYVGSNDHNVYALNANTGTKIWSYATEDSVLSNPPSPTGSDRKTNQSYINE